MITKFNKLLKRFFLAVAESKAKRALSYRHF